jgi:hypothetical protein
VTEPAVIDLSPHIAEGGRYSCSTTRSLQDFIG